jgi:hypothetical protein
MERRGHSTIAITLDIYSQDMREDAAKSLTRRCKRL